MSNKVDEARRAAELRLEASRRLVEERLDEVKSAVETKVGAVPRNASLLMVMLAGAGGFALAFRQGRRARRRSGRR